MGQLINAPAKGGLGHAFAMGQVGAGGGLNFAKGIDSAVNLSAGQYQLDFTSAGFKPGGDVVFTATSVDGSFQGIVAVFTGIIGVGYANVRFATYKFPPAVPPAFTLANITFNVWAVQVS